MRYLTLLPLLLLIGCGEPRPVTLSEWESNHPYAKPVTVIVVPGGYDIYQFTDNIPSITADGIYAVTPTQYTLAVDQSKMVYAVERAESFK